MEQDLESRKVASAMQCFFHHKLPDDQGGVCSGWFVALWPLINCQVKKVKVVKR